MKTKLTIGLFFLTVAVIFWLPGVDKTYEIKPAEAFTITYENCGVGTKVCADGTLEFNQTTPEGYVEYKLWQAGLSEETEFVKKMINCESKWRTDAVGVNTSGSYDMGIWQINSIHKDISNADKFDFKKATDWSIEKRLRDGNWSAWSCSRKVK